MANFTVTVTGNLGADVEMKKKGNKDFGVLSVAVSKGKEEAPIYVKAFVYGLSEGRRQLLTRGSLVQVIGDYSDDIYIKPQIKEDLIQNLQTNLNLNKEQKEALVIFANSFDFQKLLSNNIMINRVIQERFIDILVSKKD